MKILLAAKYGPHGPVKIGGVQSWMATIAKALTAQGHSVHLAQYGETLPDESYDLGVLAHWQFTNALAKRCRQVVNVCHGIIAAERPKRGNVLYTSEELRDHWATPGEILRQPIDLDFWTPATAQREYLTRFSYRDGLDMAVQVAQGFNLKYQHIRKATPRQAREALRQSAVVLATGRAALEAMACGVPVVICDHRAPYQGPLLDSDTLGSMAFNYSGRGGQEPVPATLSMACEAAMARGSLRWHVEEQHDSRKVANQLISVYS